MSLQNLAKIGLLVEHDTDKRQVGKLMEAAERFVEDARQETISLETRLDRVASLTTAGHSATSS